MNPQTIVKLIEWIDTELRGLNNWATRFLVDMIKIPTVSPEGKYYEEFVNVVIDRLEDFDLDIEVIRVPQEIVDKECPPEARGNPRRIVLSRVGKKGPIIHFNAHYDVVPGGPGWKVTEPFNPVVDIHNIIFGILNTHNFMSDRVTVMFFQSL